MSRPRIGADAVAEKGWPRAHVWLLLRRASQIGLVVLFLLGPWFGLWIVKGNLASSLTLGTLPLTDPYVLLQSLLARHIPQRAALIGALIVLIFYAIVGGRSYCAWVCPINPVTDAASWLRRRFGIHGGARLSRSTRYWILAMTLIVAFATGSIAWELVNPVSLVQRALIFGIGVSWTIVLAIFLFDLFVAQRGWCGHLCPVGAFYSLLSRWRLLHVTAAQRDACNDCADCYAVCPEPIIIKPALKAVDGAGPAIDAISCTNCGRCIDVCAKDVFEFSVLRRAAATHLPTAQPGGTPAD